MTQPKLPLGNILLNALQAPFRLEAASWKALIVPIVAVIATSLVPIVANTLHWGGAGGWLMLLPFWGAFALLALEYQRQLLLGAEACKKVPGLWRQY